MVKNYGSDVSREQFEIIREDLEKAKKINKTKESGALWCFLCNLVHIENRMPVEKFTKIFPELEVGILLFYSLEKTERKWEKPSWGNFKKN